MYDNNSPLNELTDRVSYAEAHTTIDSLTRALLAALELVPGWDEFHWVTSFTDPWS